MLALSKCKAHQDSPTPAQAHGTPLSHGESHPNELHRLDLRGLTTLPPNLFLPNAPTVDEMSFFGPTAGGRIDLLVSELALTGAAITFDITIGSYRKVTVETNAMAGLSVGRTLQIQTASEEVVLQEGECRPLKRLKQLPAAQ